jgi:hypothetical protein
MWQLHDAVLLQQIIMTLKVNAQTAEALERAATRHEGDVVEKLLLPGS